MDLYGITKYAAKQNVVFFLNYLVLLIFQKVRFAEEKKEMVEKKETKDAEVWTQEPDYDHFMFVRVFSPVGMSQTELKCSVTFGKQFFKTDKLDGGSPVNPSGKIEMIYVPYVFSHFSVYSVLYFLNSVKPHFNRILLHMFSYNMK